MKMTKKDKLLEWIKRQREAPKKDKNYGQLDTWDDGYDECLDAIEEFVKNEI
jgi:hypothetical protein